MSRNLLPFLYQTRTLQYACRRPATFLLTQKAGVATSNRRPKRIDNSIPFEWDDGEQSSHHEDPSEQQGTLTPSESEIFKSIFDDISQGRLPRAKKPPQQFAEASPESTQDGPESQRIGNTLIEQARGSQFGDEFLKSYPSSLRRAAKNALGKFQLAPARPRLREMTELDEAEAKQMREWARYEKIREQEKERVEKQMEACQTDLELWKVMEEEVFSLPEKLGIVEKAKKADEGSKPKKPVLELSAEVEQPKAQEEEKTEKVKTTKKGRKAKKPAKEEEKIEKAETTKTERKAKKPAHEEKRIMDVHGPLYSHYLSTGLKLLDTTFPKPSLLAFNILPRIKELGLSSFVLGASTSLYLTLADIHWKRYGDATSAFDVLDEMNKVGLFPTEHIEDLERLVEEIASHLHSCSWGAQGPFVMAMMEAPPYDASLTSRLERMQERIAKTNFYNKKDEHFRDERLKREEA
ncbi:hypothetical protein FSARC_2060 [Fusarium sarcochroum]|uniref:Mtf2-like C-terminal domain-containing protein n=1 Tax=Fusarium sarcochroum TaxID=1208366 RepID=A0A8H4U748_9HYPO|nr:hypothetical protein FSARC_2060 [Fusarium sarcochroum]